MLIEVDYLDQNGSVCYFCGQELIIDEIVEKQYNDVNRVNAKTYRCHCKQGHICYIQQYTLNDEFDLNFRLHMFVYGDDEVDHLYPILTKCLRKEGVKANAEKSKDSKNKS